MKHKCKYCKWFDDYLEGSCNPRYDYEYNKYVGKYTSKEIGNVYPENNLKGDCKYYKRDWEFISCVATIMGFILIISFLMIGFFIKGDK